LAIPEKSLGELGELRFCANALERGIVVNTPFGDNSAYDCITEHNGLLRRVQVKASATPDMFGRNKGNYWGFHISRGTSRKRPYEGGDFDVLVAYIIPHDITFIIPSDELLTHVSCKLSLNMRSDSKWAKYREAWTHLMV